MFEILQNEFCWKEKKKVIAGQTEMERSFFV